MHHPDICDILLIIQDYFILSTDTSSTCQIQAIVDDSDEHEPKRGIKISRTLLNGYLHATIWELNRDNDTVTFFYAKDLSSVEYLESIEVECRDYSHDTVRAAVRNILTFDKNATKHKHSSIAA
jgi:hypothetical protein